MYRSLFDELAQCWHVRCEGFWSVADASHYCDEIERKSSQLRAATGRARFLIDVSGHGVQSLEVMRCIRRVENAILHTHEDRLAIVQLPGLGMMQVRRRISETNSPQHRAFESLREAREWLAEPSGIADLGATRAIAQAPGRAAA